MEASEVQFGESGWMLAPIEPQDLVRVDSDEAAIPKINKAEVNIAKDLCSPNYNLQCFRLNLNPAQCFGGKCRGSARREACPS